MEQLEINIHLKYVTLKGDLIIPEVRQELLFSPMEVVVVDSVLETKW
jgi:hypothetical protein